MKFNNKKLKKNFWKNNYRKKMLRKKFSEQNVWKKFWRNYKTKLFITNIYSNIDKCHIIFALLAPFDKNRAKDRE